jgi:aminoglycoside phosphotransferase (APT) family kinase protein
LIPVPTTLSEALDPAWLSQLLGRKVASVETVEILKTMATKVRFVAHFDDGGEAALCLKAFLDLDDAMLRGGGATTLKEAEFYTKLAPHMDVTVPTLVASATSHDPALGLIVMRDLVAEGAHFCSALEPFTVDHAAQSLGQIARLHAATRLAKASDWISPRLPNMAAKPYLSVEVMQELMDGPRGEGLTAETRNATRQLAALRSLAERDADRPHFLIHGDVHAGNIYRTAAGETGLIDWQLLQRGGWALDVAYHIAAVLPVEVAEAEERHLLAHYLTAARTLGCDLPDADEAWAHYAEALAYGLYLWAMTRMVDPPIVNLFVGRLGRAVERCGSFARLGV